MPKTAPVVATEPTAEPQADEIMNRPTAPAFNDFDPAWMMGSELAPVIVPDDDGYYQDADWIRIECDWESLKPRAGFKPMWAEIDASLTFHEALAIPLVAGTPMRAIYPHIVNRVRSWNIRAFNPESGKMEPVPPPCEIGVEALFRVRPAVVEWLGSIIKLTSLQGGPNRKNETSDSADGPSGTNDAV